MPELPDVEVFRETLDATALHRRIRHAAVDAPRRMLAGVSERALRRALEGHELTATERHGKYLFAHVGRGEGQPWLLLHFGMSGSLEPRPSEAKDHIRLRLDLAGGRSLAYRSVRTLGKIGLVRSPASFVETKRLGPDALARDLDLDAFRSARAGRRGPIKSTLMNQRVLAGVGNLYADEILFQARVDPRTPTAALGDRATAAIFRAMRRVLSRAIAAHAERFPRSFLLAHRDRGGACPRCGAKIRRITVSGRTTYFCPVDQRGAFHHPPPSAT